MKYKTHIDYNRSSYTLTIVEKSSQNFKCNLYGPQLKNMNFYLTHKEMNAIEKKEGDTLKNAEFVIKIEDNSYKAIIKEIQRCPLTGKYTHLDFYVYSNKKFICDVPVVVFNKDKANKMHKLTFIYNLQKHKLYVTNGKIPNRIAIDYTQLKNNERVFFQSDKKEENKLLGGKLLCCVSK